MESISSSDPRSFNLDWLLSLPEGERQQILSELEPADLAAAQYCWPFIARPAQLPPSGDWQTWLILAGRGFGKSRTGAEWVRGAIESRRRSRIALIAPTAGDARDVMVEGESGILAISPPWCRPIYEPSKRRLTWPHGAIATLYSADEPERLRGPQHDGVWADELCSWRYPETWDLLQFGLRLGINPQAVVTTTPKPMPLLRELMKAPTTIVTRGSTYENRDNLAPEFFERIVSKYEGTTLGRQELHAEVLDDVEGALWNRGLIERYRVDTAPDLKRLVVAIDPAATSGENANETGVIVGGIGHNRHGYILDDQSLRGTPHAWAVKAITAYKLYKADRVIAETNQGGEMVENTLRTVDSRIPYKGIHASRGKRARAEPVVALYEQGKVHHVGVFPVLEDQLCQWTPGEPSPDRLDALVWALTELMLEGSDKTLRTF